MRAHTHTHAYAYTYTGSLIFTELLLFGWVETKRLYDLRNPGSQGDGSFLGITDGLKGKENGYPGEQHGCRLSSYLSLLERNVRGPFVSAEKYAMGPLSCSSHNLNMAKLKAHELA